MVYSSLPLENSDPLDGVIVDDVRLGVSRRNPIPLAVARMVGLGFWRPKSLYLSMGID